MNIRQITRVSFFSAFIVVSTYIVPPITVPFVNVPFTLQTFMVILIGFLLKPSEAFLSVFIYVLIGALGLPVFSGARGGFSVLIGPTGGFIMLFPFVSYTISLLKSNDKNILIDLGFGFLVSIIALYLIANLWLSYILNINYLKSLLALLAFVPFDLIKLFLAYFVYKKIPSDFINT